MKLFSLIISGILLSFINIYPQVKGFASFDQEKLLQEEMKTALNADQLSTGEQMIIGDEVVPEFYYLGPGDILSYLNLSISSMPVYITVSPENSLLIPRIGEIKVKDLTLAQAKLEIQKKVKEVNANAITGVSLFKPRKVFVSVSGNLLNPGIFSFPASYRISTALKSVQKLSSNEQKQPQVLLNLEIMQDKNQKIERSYFGTGISTNIDLSKRSILIINKNGISFNADIEKAKVNNDITLDPYLRENDQIVIPFTKDNISYVSVTGAVNRPIRVPYKEGDKISEIIKMAYGFTEDADIQNIKYIGKNQDERTVVINNSQVTNDFEVSPGAGIIVPFKQKKEDANIGFVSVTGEVNKPGTFPIIPGVTKLKDILEAAGSFTNKAYLPLAHIIRSQGNSVNDKFNNEFFDLMRSSDLKLEDTTRFKFNLISNMNIVSCSFTDLFVNNSERDNIALLDGDAIIIPENPRTIYISGYVKKPGYLTFEAGKTMDWYIEQAGGITEGGKRSRARIIRGNNNSWIEGDDDVFVYAGDRIYVPTSPDMPPGTDIQSYSLIFTGISTLVTLTYLILSLVNK